jgi:hypothetical protein
VVDFVVGVISVKWKKSLKFHKKSKVDVVAVHWTVDRLVRVVSCRERGNLSGDVLIHEQESLRVMFSNK